MLADDYPDWTNATSFVRSGPLGPYSTFRGERFPTPAVARIAMLRRYGRVYVFWSHHGRWLARVPKPKPWQLPPTP